MKVSIWDIKASREDGVIMHFEIIVPITMTNRNVVNAYANDYLKTKLFLSNKMTSSKCSFCQIESRSPNITGQIYDRGYSIEEIVNYNT